MQHYPGTGIAAPVPRDRISADTGEAILLRLFPDQRPVWNSLDDPYLASWIVLTGIKQARFRDKGLVDLRGVREDIDLAYSGNHSLLAGKVSPHGFLTPLETDEEVALAVQAAQAYQWDTNWDPTTIN